MKDTEKNKNEGDTAGNQQKDLPTPSKQNSKNSYQKNTKIQNSTSIPPFQLKNPPNPNFHAWELVRSQDILQLLWRWHLEAPLRSDKRETGFNRSETWPAEFLTV